MRILIATTGVLPAAPVAELCDRLGGANGTVTVMTVIRVPRSFLDEMDDDVRRSFLDDSPLESSDAEKKTARYLEERGQRNVEPIVAALRSFGIEAGTRYVVGATRRLFTEEAWRSVSARVMDKSHLPVLLVPGAKIEDTQEMIIEL